MTFSEKQQELIIVSYSLKDYIETSSDLQIPTLTPQNILTITHIIYHITREKLSSVILANNICSLALILDTTKNADEFELILIQLILV